MPAPARCARTDEVAVCLRDHGHPGLCVSPEMSADPQMPATALTADELTEARGWIADCTWADSIDPYALTDAQVERGIARHYAGGIAQFRTDAA